MAKESKATQADNKRLHDNIKLLEKLYQRKALIDVIGCCAATWDSRVQKPWTFQYHELRTIANYCHVDFVQLVTGRLSIM